MITQNSQEKKRLPMVERHILSAGRKRLGIGNKWWPPIVNSSEFEYESKSEYKHINHDYIFDKDVDIIKYVTAETAN